jgi:hypothetical protein
MSIILGVERRIVQFSYSFLVTFPPETRQEITEG